MLIEVLSESTEKHDRGKKFQYYRSIESFQEYMLVAQDAPHVDYYRRQSEDLWLLTSINQEAGQLYLPSIDCSLTLAEIYAKVRFDASPAP